MLFEESEKWRRGLFSVARFDGAILSFHAMMRVVYLASASDTYRKEEEKKKKKKKRRRKMTEEGKKGQQRGSNGVG